MDIMNTTNNHDAELVARINEAYREKQILFNDILTLLKKRDADEISQYENCYANNIEDYDYLMHIADDQDLECILNYCRVYF